MLVVPQIVLTSLNRKISAGGSDSRICSRISGGSPASGKDCIPNSKLGGMDENRRRSTVSLLRSCRCASRSMGRIIPHQHQPRGRLSHAASALEWTNLSVLLSSFYRTLHVEPLDHTCNACNEKKGVWPRDNMFVRLEAHFAPNFFVS